MTATDDAEGPAAEGDGTREGAGAAVEEDGAREGDDGAGSAAYSGLFGAFPYAVRASESWLLRSYVLAGGLLAALVALAFAVAVVDLLAQTSGVAGGTFTFSRAFVVFVGFAVVAPLVAPVLSVARRHRRGGASRRFDAAMALAGYAFVAALFVALVVSAPPALRDPATGPVVAFLYSLPPLAGLGPPVAVALAMWLLHRRWPTGA